MHSLSTWGYWRVFIQRAHALEGKTVDYLIHGHSAPFQRTLEIRLRIDALFAGIQPWLRLNVDAVANDAVAAPLNIPYCYGAYWQRRGAGEVMRDHIVFERVYLHLSNGVCRFFLLRFFSSYCWRNVVCFPNQPALSAIVMFNVSKVYSFPSAGIVALVLEGVCFLELFTIGF